MTRDEYVKIAAWARKVNREGNIILRALEDGDPPENKRLLIQAKQLYRITNSVVSASEKMAKTIDAYILSEIDELADIEVEQELPG